ncbi:hypothetical protein D0868_15615 [Hortaea werneckii]|uniref:Stress-associated endoplasmic reticulum protein n=1 Tax=Hortaea werneckii TaxID=91943 RepID=A0A3M6WZ48_HORWE|nr:hypothetical protein D0868_15615 [Hortaea werneckii]
MYESTLDQKGKLTRPVSFLLFQAQTPQQRRANNTFAKAEERKRGKPQGEVLRKEKPAKAPISKTWVCKCLSLPLTSIPLIFLVRPGLLEFRKS